MFIPVPTRHRASTDSHSAHATPCLEPSPRGLKVGCRLLLQSADPLPDQPNQVTAIDFVPIQPRQITANSNQSP